MMDMHMLCFALQLVDMVWVKPVWTALFHAPL